MWPQRWQPTRLPCPWDSPGKNTGVGCHFLLQCMKVKSEGEVALSCPTLSDPMDCSLPGSSVHGIFQAKVLEWGAIVHVRFRKVTGEVKHTEVLIKKLSAFVLREYYLLEMETNLDLQLGSQIREKSMNAMLWVCMSPQHSCVKILIPKLIVLGGRARPIFFPTSFICFSASMANPWFS